MSSSKTRKTRYPLAKVTKAMWLVKEFCKLAGIFDDELCQLVGVNQLPQTVKAVKAVERKTRKREGLAVDKEISHALSLSLNVSSLCEGDSCTDIESVTVDLSTFFIDGELSLIAAPVMPLVRVTYAGEEVVQFPLEELINGDRQAARPVRGPVGDKPS